VQRHTVGGWGETGPVERAGLVIAKQLPQQDPPSTTAPTLVQVGGGEPPHKEGGPFLCSHGQLRVCQGVGRCLALLCPHVHPLDAHADTLRPCSLLLLLLSSLQPEDYWSPAIDVPPGYGYQDDYGPISPMPNHDGTGEGALSGL
jgi:hypothetical protein